MKRIILISLLSLPLMTFVWSQDCCEAEEIGMSDTALALYMCQNYKKLSNRSHNTVRRWFKDIRLGLYE